MTVADPRDVLLLTFRERGNPEPRGRADPWGTAGFQAGAIVRVLRWQPVVVANASITGRFEKVAQTSVTGMGVCLSDCDRAIVLRHESVRVR